MNLPEPLSQLAAGPIFVVGKERSGTTWVYDILTNHSEVAGVLESWMFAADDGLGGLFREPHWAEPDRLPRPGLGQLIARADMITHVRALTSQWLAQALQPHHHFLVEKSTAHTWVMDHIVEVFPEARFVHVLRDGRDVAVSIQAAAESWAPAWAQTFGKTVTAAAESWRAAVQTIQTSSKKLGDRFLEVRFEELKADPTACCRRLFQFCEVPCDEYVLSNIVTATDFDHCYVGGEGCYRRGGRVGDWRHRFNNADRKAFEEEAGDLLIALAYEEDRSWHEHPEQ